MRAYRITNEQLLIGVQDLDRLGVHKSTLASETIDRNTSFLFAFTATAHSTGDWGILSALPEYLKKMYPNSRLVVPNSDLLLKIFKSPFAAGEWSSVTKEPWKTSYMVWQNNPYIDHWVQPGEFSGEYITDHARAWSSYTNYTEPLVEQVLRALGAKDEELIQWDTRPRLYFTEQEQEECDKIVKQCVGDNKYGCLLFGGRVQGFTGRWEFDHVLHEDARAYSDMPVFYYSQFDLQDTEWASIFKHRINFEDLKLTLRQQLCIKQKAYFNLGYQAGMTDAISGGGSNVISLTPFDENGLGSNCIRGVKYWFRDGTTKIY